MVDGLELGEAGGRETKEEASVVIQENGPVSLNEGD